MTSTRLQIYEANLDVEKSTPASGLVEIYDGFIDRYGVIRRRPGFYQKSALDVEEFTKSGVYYWKEKGMYIKVSNGSISYTTDISIVPITWNSLSSDTLENNGYPLFATQGSWLFIANTGGGKGILSNVNGVGEYINTNDPIVPTSINGIACLDGYILASETGTKRVWYTKTPDADETVRPEFDQYFSAIGTPGYIQGIKAINRELYVIKTDSVEVWYDDGIAPFRRYEGAVIPVGCVAPGSIAIVDDNIWFLNQLRQVVKINGRQTEIMSEKIDSQLKQITQLVDARLFQLDTFVILTFPSKDITYVYDLVTKNWYIWGVWDSVKLRYKRYPVIDADKDNSRWFLAAESTSASNTGSFSIFARGICSDNGVDNRFMIRTAFVDHGNFYTKRSNKLTLKIVRETDVIPIKEPPDGERCTFYIFTFDSLDSKIESVSGLPAGITFNYATQTISGITSLTGVFDIEITVNQNNEIRIVKDQVYFAENPEWELSL